MDGNEIRVEIVRAVGMKGNGKGQIRSDQRNRISRNKGGNQRIKTSITANGSRDENM